MLERTMVASARQADSTDRERHRRAGSLFCAVRGGRSCARKAAAERVVWQKPAQAGYLPGGPFTAIASERR